MRKCFRALLCASLLTTVLLPLVAEAADKQVVTVSCRSDNSAVVASTNSANAPTVTATTWAQAIADVSNAGLELKDIGSVGNG